jgi:predicted metalloprotease
MGINLLKRLMRRGESPDVAVATVCSHEFGHILQFKHGLIEKVDAGHKTVKEVSCRLITLPDTLQD